MSYIFPIQRIASRVLFNRIMEFDREVPSSRRGSVSVELWDCSGDQQYESTWPAIIRDIHGVVVVYNPENRGHESEVGLWSETRLT